MAWISCSDVSIINSTLASPWFRPAAAAPAEKTQQRQPNSRSHLSPRLYRNQIACAPVFAQRHHTIDRQVLGQIVVGRKDDDDIDIVGAGRRRHKAPIDDQTLDNSAGARLAQELSEFRPEARTAIASRERAESPRDFRGGALMDSIGKQAGIIERWNRHRNLRAPPSQ